MRAPWAGWGLAYLALPEGHRDPPLGANVTDVAGDGGPLMAIGKRKMTEMSKPAEILYGAIFEALRFAKRQQWVITNYVLALMGAVSGWPS